MTPQRRRRKLARWFNKRGRISGLEARRWNFYPSGNLWVQEEFCHAWKRLTPEWNRTFRAMLREIK